MTDARLEAAIQVCEAIARGEKPELRRSDLSPLSLEELKLVSTSVAVWAPRDPRVLHDELASVSATPQLREIVDRWRRDPGDPVFRAQDAVRASVNQSPPDPWRDLCNQEAEERGEL